MNKNNSFNIVTNSYEEEILSLKDASLSYAYAKTFPSSINIKLHEKIVLDSLIASYNYKFALNIPNCDIKAHEKVVLDSKNLFYNYLFAKDIENADILKHAKVIADSNDIGWILSFKKATNISDFDLLSCCSLENKKIVEDYLICKKNIKSLKKNM